MKKLNGTLAAFASLALIAGSSNAFAQDPPAQPAPQRQAEAPKPHSVSGELVKVDADAQMISIKGADGTEQAFRYTDATEVAGAQEGVAGLATKAGTRVTVHFTGDEDARTAVKIEVEAQR